MIRPTRIHQKPSKVRVQKSISFWYRFWNYLCNFWAPKELQIDLKILPKCSQGPGDFWTRPTFWQFRTQDGSRSPQDVKKWQFWYPKWPPWAPKSIPKPPQDLKIITKMRPELKLYTLLWIYLPVTLLYLTLSTVAISNRYQSFNNISTRQHNSNFTPHTSDITRPTWHVALHTLHFTLPSRHSIRPGGLREAIK